MGNVDDNKAEDKQTEFVEKDNTDEKSQQHELSSGKKMINDFDSDQDFKSLLAYVQLNRG